MCLEKASLIDLPEPLEGMAVPDTGADGGGRESELRRRDFQEMKPTMFEVTKSRNCLSACHIYIEKNVSCLRHDCLWATGAGDKLTGAKRNS